MSLVTSKPLQQASTSSTLMPRVRRGRRRVGLHQDRQRVGVAGVGDPHLGAVDDVVVAVEPRSGADALQVRAGVGLGEADAGAALAGGQVGQVLLLLLLGAVHGDHPAGQRVAAEDAGDAHPAAGDLLEHQGEGDRVEVEAAVLLGDGDAEQAHVGHALDDLGGVATGLLPLTGDRDDLVVDEVAEQRTELALVLVELEVHGSASLVGRVGQGCGAEDGQGAAVGQVDPADPHRVADRASVGVVGPRAG